MRYDDLVPSLEKSIPFELYSIDRIADYSGCYCLTNASGDILYIGQAVSIRNRLGQHFEGEKRSTLTVYGRVSKAWWRVHPVASLNALERGWLESYLLHEGVLPPLNKASAPI